MPWPMLRRVGMATMLRMRGSKSARNVPLAFTTSEPGAELEMGVPMKNLCNQLGVQRFLKLMP